MDDSKGSMMLEYVLLTFFVAVPVYLIWQGAPNWRIENENGGRELVFLGIYDGVTGKLKLGGLAIQGFYQRIMSGVALPVP